MQIDFVRAGHFTVLLDLENTGRHAVHLEGIPTTAFGLWGIDKVSSDWTQRSDDRTRLGYQPMRPITLAPDDTITVRLDFRFGDGDLTNQGTPVSAPVVDDLPVAYRTLGFRRTTLVPLQAAILSVFANGNCANQILGN